MLAKGNRESEGAFDIVQPSDYMVKQMADQGMLRSWKQDELTNLGNIGSQYLNTEYDPGTSIPSRIRADGGHCRQHFQDYQHYVLCGSFDEKYKQQMVVLDDYRAIIGVAARSIGLQHERDGSRQAGAG